MIAIGFVAQAWPAARTARGLPALAASSGVGDGHAVGDAHHRLAAGAVEAVGERPVEPDVELLQLAGEVAVELIAHVGEGGIVLADLHPEARAEVVGHALRRLTGERQAQQALRSTRKRQDTDRRFDGRHGNFPTA